jgi:hypothetical protein
MGNLALSSLSTLIAEHAPGMFKEQFPLSAPLADALPHIDCDGDELVVDITDDGVQSVSTVRDNALLPRPNEGNIAKARYLPGQVFASIRIGRGAADMKGAAKNAGTLAEREIKKASKNALAYLDKSIANDGVSPQAGATWSAIDETGTVSVNFNDVSLFVPGVAYEFLDVSASQSFTVLCTNVVRATVGSFSGAVAGTASFANTIVNPTTGADVDLANTTVATGDTFRLRGQASGFGGSNSVVKDINSIVDAGASTGTFAGVSPTAPVGNNPAMPAWRGTTLAASTLFSQEIVERLMGTVQVVGGERPNMIVMHPSLYGAFKASGQIIGSVFGITGGLSAATPMQLSGSIDKYSGKGNETLCGAKVVVTPNIVSQTLFALHTDDHKLAVGREFAPDTDGRGDALLVPLDRNSFESQIRGLYQFYVERRSTIGVLTTFTGL